jgi:hypothetical protein
VHGGIFRSELARDTKLVLRARRIMKLVNEHIREAKAKLDRALCIRRHRTCAKQSHEFGPALFIGEAICECVRRFRGAGIVLERELVQQRGRLGLEHAKQARPGERGERRLIIIAVGARGLREYRQMARGLARIALRERD